MARRPKINPRLGGTQSGSLSQHEHDFHIRCPQSSQNFIPLSKFLLLPKNFFFILFLLCELVQNSTDDNEWRGDYPKKGKQRPDACNKPTNDRHGDLLG